MIGSPGLPTGRFVSAVLSLGGSSFKVIGVCIPWSGAHVRTGRRDRNLWQDHNTYLKHLSSIIRSSPLRLVVAGDFNQRIPRRRQPFESYELLTMAFRGLQIHSEDFGDPPLIDHVATTNGFNVIDLQVISRHFNGSRLTDHDGVSVTLNTEIRHPIAT